MKTCEEGEAKVHGLSISPCGRLLLISFGDHIEIASISKIMTPPDPREIPLASVVIHKVSNFNESKVTQMIWNPSITETTQSKHFPLLNHIREIDCQFVVHCKNNKVYICYVGVEAAQLSDGHAGKQLD